MSTVTEEPAVAERKFVSTKIADDVLDEARIASSMRKMSLAAYLSEVVMEAAKRDIARETAKRARADQKGKE